jgi:effector-binding domain-containing protein
MTRVTASVAIKEVPPTLFMVSSHDGVTIPEIPAISRGELDQMLTELATNGGTSGSPVHFIYHGADGSNTTRFRLVLAVPVAEPPSHVPEPYELFESAPFRCVATDYVGPMRDIKQGYARLFEAMEEQGLQRTDESREIYVKWIGYDSPDNVTELQIGVV